MGEAITAQMMSDLPYTCENQAPPQKVADSKSINNNLKVFNFSPKIYYASTILSKIWEHLDALAKIESEENHVPLERAKEAFARAIVLQPTILIHDVEISPSLPILWTTKNSTISSLIMEVMFRIMRVHSNIIIHVDARRERLVSYLARILEWETNLNSESKLEVGIERRFDEECSMFVFRSSDIEAAIDCLSLSIGDPFGEHRVREVYVQESVLDSFRNKLQRKLPRYSLEVLNDPLLQKRHEEIVEILKKLNAPTIRPLNASEGDVTPIVCCEFDLSYFPPNYPVVILKVFRTVNDVVHLANGARNASIWTENLALAYNLVNNLDCRHFWINCLGVSCQMWTELSMLLKHSNELVVFEKFGDSGVRMENSHHFEYFQVKDFPKFVAFPFGVSFAN